MARDGRTQLFFIFCVLFGVGCVYCQETKKENVETGKSYTFKPNVNSTITIIAWKFTQKPGDVIKLVDWDPQTGVYWYSHQDRATFTTENGKLTVNTLTKEDSGLYEGELEVDGVLKTFKYELTVMDGVSKPQVTCDFKDNTIDLVCSVDPQVNAEFTWRGRNGIQKEGKSSDSDYFCTAKHEVSTKDTQWKPTDYDKDGRVSEDGILTQGERISIPEEQSSNSVYFCTAKNEVSTKTTEFKLKDCYKDPLNDQ